MAQFNLIMSVFTNRLVILLSSTLAANALAQNPSSPVLLPGVTVTANKTEQKLSQTGKVVTVLSDSVLQRYATQTVSELLSRQAGVQVIGAQNTYGTNQDLFIRGASAGNTLILLDGIPVYDPTSTVPVFDLNLLTVGECERIEILKGAQSTLYGSDAVAGVIQIFTRKATSAKPIGGSVSLNAGSYNTFRGTASLNGTTRSVYYNVQYTRLQSRGFSAAHDQPGNQGFDRDGIRQNNLLANVGVRITDKLTWKLRGILTNYRTDLDAGAFTDEKDYTSRNKYGLIATGLDYRYGSKGQLTVNYGYTHTQRTYRDDSTWIAPNAYYRYTKTVYTGSTHYADLYNRLKVGSFLDWIVGADYRFNNTNQNDVSVSAYGIEPSPPIGADTARIHLWSAYTSGLFSSGTNAFLEVGGRFNRHSLYGNNFTYSVNPSYLLNDRLKVFANLSSGFRAPSLYQLFSPYGNKALQPEKSRSFEAGLQFFGRNQQNFVRMVYFDRLIRNVIFFESINQPPYGQYINFDRQHDHGLELEGQGRTGAFTYWGNLTYLQGKVNTRIGEQDTTYNNLFRRPKWLMNAGVGYQFNQRLSASLTVRSVGKRIDRFYNSETFATESVTLNPYSTVDLYADYRLLKNLRIYVDLRNLLNVQYYDLYGYNTRRFNFMAGVRFNL